jgi:predicted RNase H-like nuclease (RuvC/YqgF family)
MLKWIRKYIPPLAEIDELNELWDLELDRAEELSGACVALRQRIEDLQHENFNLDKINGIKDREISGYKDELEPLRRENFRLKAEGRKQAERTMLEWHRAESAEALVRQTDAAFGYTPPISTNEV